MNGHIIWLFTACSDTETKVHVTTEIERFQRAFKAYATGTSTTTWTKSFEAEYKGFQFGLSEHAGVPLFSGDLEVNVEDTFADIDYNSHYSKEVDAAAVKFQDKLQEFQRITTVISVGGKSIRKVDETHEMPIERSNVLTKEDLRKRAIEHMSLHYNLTNSVIPNPDVALFETSSSCIQGKILLVLISFKFCFHLNQKCWPNLIKDIYLLTLFQIFQKFVR